MAKRQRHYDEPPVTHYFADGTVIKGSIKPGQMMIPADSKFYDLMADIIRKYGA